jgi:hypothetical protein
MFSLREYVNSQYSSLLVKTSEIINKKYDSSNLNIAQPICALNHHIVFYLYVYTCFKKTLDRFNNEVYFVGSFPKVAT